MSIKNFCCGRVSQELTEVVIERAKDLNDALFEASKAGLRIEVVSDETQIYESPHTFPFQRVSVWRGGRLLAVLELRES